MQRPAAASLEHLVYTERADELFAPLQHETISISLTHLAAPAKERDQVPLSEAAIRQAEPRLKPYKISDGGGLYVSVQPSGSKLWRFKYRHEGNENTLSFGSHPGVSLADARGKSGVHGTCCPSTRTLGLNSATGPCGRRSKQ